MLERIVDGRTDLVWEYVAAGHPTSSADADGVSLIKWCAHYGDVSAIRYLLGRGETLTSLGENLGLHGAAFHGHWRLCQFLIESGAVVNAPLPDTGETALHAATCKANRPAYQLGELAPASRFDTPEALLRRVRHPSGPAVDVRPRPRMGRDGVVSARKAARVTWAPTPTRRPS